MAQAANPFFGTYKTPHQTAPFDKIKLSHYEPAFKKAIEENQKEIDAIVNQRSMPTFENTIEALDRSGQMLNRVASAFFALLSAESNDEMMEISQRVQPMLSEHSNNISLNEKLFDRIKFVYDRRDQLDLLLFVVLLDIDRHLIEKADLVGIGADVDHSRRFDHPLQETNPAFIFVLEFLCSIIFEILRKVALGPRFFYILQRFLADNELSVFDFLLHLFDIAFRQLIMHDFLHF